MDDLDRCAVCGCPRPSDPAAALAGSTAREGERVSWACARCTREHTRSIEARLDEEWW